MAGILRWFLCGLPCDGSRLRGIALPGKRRGATAIMGRHDQFPLDISGNWYINPDYSVPQTPVGRDDEGR